MFLREIISSADFTRLINELNAAQNPVALFGLPKTARAAYIRALAQVTGRKIIVLTKDERSANKLAEDVDFFREGVRVFSPRDLTLRPLESFSREYEYRRIRVLGNLVGNKAQVIISPTEAALMYTMPREKFVENTLTIHDTDSLNPTEFSQKLVNAGYIRRDMVEGPGQFAVRGDIIDLYTPDMPRPVRIELWGDEIDRINTFDLETQRRTENIKKVHISPVKEVLFTDRERALNALHDFRQKLTAKQRENFDRATEKDIITLENGIVPRSMDKYISICYEKKATLFDYVDNPIIFVDDWNSVKESYTDFCRAQTKDIETLFEDKVLTQGMEEFFAPLSLITDLRGREKFIAAEDFMRSINDFPLSAIINISCSPTPGWNGEYKQLAEDMTAMMKNGYRVLVLAGTEKSAQTLAGDLSDMGFNAMYVTGDVNIPGGTVAVARGKTSRGFELLTERFCLITGHKRNVGRQRIKPKKKDKNSITSIDQISKGDYVVHQNYGIGVYQGIQSVTMQGITKDYLLIQYQGKDSLYVPVTQLDLISRYTYSKDDEKVTLSKLGSDTWNKQKRKAKKATEEMAKELIELYAKREHSKGYAFDPDNEWQRDFEARFFYEETEDQLRCIGEIKRDMESGRPMERLLCGDVGVGKTEVALRAAFKAVMNGKQVAILVPTTVLAWQHYNTMVQRMESFPVNIQLLSRFRSLKQRKQTIQDINDGVADIVVGTHALIQKSVKFKNLGLLIIDEEQRFGVAHKEKLVEGFTGVDVLTLSATPIPRTLSMALNGIRDMSTIEQPPVDRIPIETYVCEYNEKLIARALNRELNRGGQCYYLHNRVETIDLRAQRVQNMCPEARIGIAHGQMDEASLSAVWQQLMNGEIDILVCTTIIETGIDVSNCNTLVIEDADRMGLAQLYQIRGRVGRSTRKAYAYFTFRRNKVLNEVAVKRLNAIKEFTSFGSGFKIAMRDLQIRGAGSVLGKTQSGFMSSVGYDLYIKLLNQAIAVQRGEKPKTEKSDCVVDISVDAFIPDKYISNTSNRIEAYKKIASLETRDDVSDLLDELIDRYGDVPESVMGLIEISLMRVQAASLGITEIVQRKDTVIFYGSKFSQINMTEFLKKTKFRIVINSAGKQYISAQIPVGGNSIDTMKSVLETLLECKDKDE